MTSNSRFNMVHAVFTIVFFACCLSSLPAMASEAILDFSSTVIVNPDASITVTENIRAECERRNIRHGIYREIPVKYSAGNALSINSRLRVLEVKIDGQRAPFHTKKRNAYIKIYMGSKNRILPVGIHTFELTYKMHRMIGFFDDYDELYWNVTGDRWQFPIEAARVTVVLPGKTRFLQHASYTGRHGSRENNARLVETGSKSITFATTAPLMPGQGFTVAVAWPPGLVKRPGFLEKLFIILADNIATLAGLIGVGLLLIYYFSAWKKVGKDPEPGQIIPMFEPPRLFGPAAARFIRKMGFDNKVFSSAVLNLAVKGYLNIKEEDGTFFLEKKKGPGKKGELSEGEKALFAKLFHASDEIELSQAERFRVQSSLKALKDNLKAHFERIYFRLNSKHLIPGIVISVLTIVAIALGSDDIFAALFMSLWLSGWSGFTALLDYMAYNAIKTAYNSRSSKAFKDVAKTALFALPFTIFWFVGCFMYATVVGIQGLMVFIILVAVNLVFYQLMKAPTMQGRKILDHIEGFRMFLQTAEKDRLNELTSPDNRSRLFEKYLPWAVALDVENQWAERFTRYLEEAGTPVASGQYSPSWYIGSYHTPVALSHSIGTSLASAVESASISPGSSSGSGGGGFSGGGGGGGGGGGW